MSGLMFIIVLFVIVCGFGCYTADHYGSDYSAFDRFADDHPFLAIIEGGCCTLLVISVLIGVLWCVSQVLSPEPSTEQPPKHPTTILPMQVQIQLLRQLSRQLFIPDSSMQILLRDLLYILQMISLQSAQLPRMTFTLS